MKYPARNKTHRQLQMPSKCTANQCCQQEAEKKKKCSVTE
jgi:hypothetical protein